MPTLKLPQEDPARPVRRQIIPGGEALIAREAQRAAGVAQDIFNVVVGQEIREQEKEAAKAARAQELDERKESATQQAVAEAEFGEAVSGFTKRLETASDAELAPDAVTGMFESARDAARSGIDDPAAQADFDLSTRVGEPEIRAQVEGLIRVERGKRQLVRFDRARSQLWSGATIEDFADRIDAIPAFLDRFRDVYDSKFLNDKRQETETEIAVTAAQDGLITRPFDTEQLINDGLFDPFMSARGAGDLRRQALNAVAKETGSVFELIRNLGVNGQDPRVTQENHGAAAQGVGLLRLGTDDAIRKILEADELLDQPGVERSITPAQMNKYRWDGSDAAAGVVNLEASIGRGGGMRSGALRSFGANDPQSVEDINNFDSRDKKIAARHAADMAALDQLQARKTALALSPDPEEEAQQQVDMRDLSESISVLFLQRTNQAGFISTTDARFITQLWGRQDEVGLRVATMALGNAMLTMDSSLVTLAQKSRFTSEMQRVLGDDAMAQIRMGIELGGDAKAVRSAREIANDKNASDSLEKRWVEFTKRGTDTKNSMETMIRALALEEGATDVGGGFFVDMTDKVHKAYLFNGGHPRAAVQTAFDEEVAEEQWGSVNGIWMRGDPDHIADWAVEHLTQEIFKETGQPYSDFLPVKVGNTGAPFLPNAPVGSDPNKTYLIMDPKTNTALLKRDGSLFFVEVDDKQTESFKENQRRARSLAVDRKLNPLGLTQVRIGLHRFTTSAIRDTQDEINVLGSTPSRTSRINTLNDVLAEIGRMLVLREQGQTTPEKAQKTLDGLIKTLQSAGVEVPEELRKSLNVIKVPSGD